MDQGLSLMTEGRTFKRYVREQMAETGEKYTQARRRILREALTDPDAADQATVSYLRDNPEVIAEIQRTMPRQQ